MIGLLLVAGLVYPKKTAELIFGNKTPPPTLKVAATKTAPAPRSSAPLDDLQGLRAAHQAMHFKDLLTSLPNANSPLLTKPEINQFLEAQGRNPLNLIAAARLSHDPQYLQEAAKAFPQDPSVQLELALHGATAEEKAAALKNFRELAPENSLGDYLAAAEAFKNGDAGSAGLALAQSLDSSLFADYNSQIMESAQSALENAGYHEEVAFGLTMGVTDLNFLNTLSRLSTDLKAVQDGFINEADFDSAEPTVVIGLTLGQRIQESSPMLINQLMGIAIERQFLNQLDPLTMIGPNGQTAIERISLLEAKRDEIKTLSQSTVANLPSMDEATLAQYSRLVKSQGELEALRWLKDQK